jgi:ring-1,2-phenylacetyl-CoA epoxidase subunit PaaC
MNTIYSNHINNILFLADSALILGQRNAEWCGHGPVLEQDIAITNITLDLIGQARLLYQHAAQLINEIHGGNETEDSLAYLRNEREFKNMLICELPKGDWAVTTLRQFFFSSYYQLLFDRMKNNEDVQLAAIAAKSLKEINYHVRWSGEWVVRLGDGTEESHNRMMTAIDELWPYTGEFFIPAGFEENIDDSLTIEWTNRVKGVFDEATLSIPENVFMQTGGKKGMHTEHLGYILSEMQSLHRAYPGVEW